MQRHVDSDSGPSDEHHRCSWKWVAHCLWVIPIQSKDGLSLAYTVLEIGVNLHQNGIIYTNAGYLPSF